MKDSRVQNQMHRKDAKRRYWKYHPAHRMELSIIYFLRAKQLALGETYFFPLLVRGKVLKATLTVERREFVKNKKLGNVRTLVLRTSEGGRFWITDDERRLPVKIETESRIGADKSHFNQR